MNLMIVTRFLIVLAAGLLSAVASAQPAADGPRVRGESEQTRNRLREADRLIRDGKPADAADELQRLLDEAGDDLISMGSGRFVPARRLAQGLLASLPPDALKVFRDRIDAPARKLLEQGRTARDPRPLRLLLDRYFVSRAAEEALLLLGDLAFERGEFRIAAGYWRRVLPGTPAEEWPFPDPKTDPASVRAKVVLAEIYDGDSSRASAEFASLKEKFPTASGRLAGKDGPYVAALEPLLKDRPPWPPEPAGLGEWPTFAGSYSRSGQATGRLPLYWPSEPTWKIAIPRDGPGAGPAASPRQCAFHPVVLNGTAYLADPVRVFGFHLQTGRLAATYDLRDDPDVPQLAKEKVAVPPPAGADYTLTAADGRLYARLGANEPPPLLPGGRAAPTSYLVCLTAGDGQLAVRWKLPPPTADGVAAAWEGAPVVAGGHLFAAMARVEGSRLVHAIAAFDDPPGKPLWIADVCDTRRDVSQPPQPLALVDGKLVFCSHGGIVAAVEAATGKPAWAFQYPQTRRLAGKPSPRDLCPPVADGGRVFVAPADAEAVFALDAGSGKLLWEAGPFQVEQLLGVANGRLIVTMAQTHRGYVNYGIRGFSVRDGSTREPDGWSRHDAPGLPNFGRGLIAGDTILWPSGSEHSSQISRVSTENGYPVRKSLPGSRGNLAYAEGVLLVASPTELRGYVADRSQLNLPQPPVPVWPGPVRTVVAAATQVAPAIAPAEPVLRRPIVDRDVGSIPALNEPVQVRQAVAFPNPLCVSLRPFPGETGLPGLGRDVPAALRRLLVTDGRRLYAYRPTEERPAWTAELPLGLIATHAIVVEDRIVLAGPTGVTAVALSDGTLGPAVRTPGFDDAPTLTSFTLAGSQVVARLGDHHLVGFDPWMGQASWVLDGQKQSRFTPYPIPSAPAFQPHLGTLGSSVFVQLTTGQRWTVDAATGQVVHDAPTAANSWPSSPALFAAGRLAVSDGAGLVRAVDAANRRQWDHDYGGEASLTGRPPALRNVNGSLLAAVFRNHGVEVHRLITDGRWSRPRFLPTAEVDLLAADCDETAMYIPHDGRVTIFPFENAPPRTITLDESAAWAVRAGRRAILAHPVHAIPTDPPAAVFDRAVIRFLQAPTAWRLPGLMAAVYDAWAVRDVAVVLLDKTDGRVKQRLDLPAFGPFVGVQLGADDAVIVTAGKAYWLK